MKGKAESLTCVEIVVHSFPWTDPCDTSRKMLIELVRDINDKRIGPGNPIPTYGDGIILGMGTADRIWVSGGDQFITIACPCRKAYKASRTHLDTGYHPSICVHLPLRLLKEL